MGLGCAFFEVADKDMPLDVYPVERYLRIAGSLPTNVLQAACWITGTHIHIGMPDPETAINIYNNIVSSGEVDNLCAMGDKSCGERLSLYKLMQSEPSPDIYPDGWKSFYNHSISDEFTEDPRKNWKLIRISPHGTIEFRMFGATDSLSEIYNWAKACHSLTIQNNH